MRLIERLGMTALHRLDPETAHALALRALRSGAVPMPGPVARPSLEVGIAGLTLPNPVGLAAGFDKSATAVAPLMRAGFGFLEIGAVTPAAQAGNPRPRIFRLPVDGAVINRCGFNNDGMRAVAARLAHRPRGIPVGVNLGTNRESPDRAGDFCAVLAACGPHADFAVLNVSSPNTAGLRDLQQPGALRATLSRLLDVARALPRPIPVFVKISPDLGTAELADVAATCLEGGAAALVCSNTTVARGSLKSARRAEPGGVSGTPLFEMSNRMLAQAARATDGRLPLIGVGGVSSAREAYAKIKAGASAIQLYTALTYHGLSLAALIAEGLADLLEQDGHAHIGDAVGTDPAPWL